MEVKGLVYSPAEWAEKEEGLDPAGKPVTFEEIEALATTPPDKTPFYVGDPWNIEAAVENSKTGVETFWEVLAVAELTEPEIWRCEVETTAPLKGVAPILITVQPLGAL